MKNEQKIISLLEEIKKLINDDEAGKQELEDYNFKVNSDGWEKITVDDKKYLESPTKDIWEILGGERDGEQLFTFDAAIRETKKAGKTIPSDEDFNNISLKDIKNIRYSGFRGTSGVFNGLGSNLGLWSSTPSGSSNAWYRFLYSSYSTVYRGYDSRAVGFAVRCLKD